MSEKPARVKRVIEVDLPRPRAFGMLTSARFLELYTEALGALRGDGAGLPVP
jgi:ABC-type nitrate/sulfonate/bicarbonate transport system ATPase subunit